MHLAVTIIDHNPVFTIVESRERVPRHHRRWPACSGLHLTLVLDNWKYAIMSQVKDLLLHDHSTVLPDYGRIQRLSDALQDLYKDFDGLKERLAGLTTRFHRVEAFVDGARPGRKRAGGAGGAGGRPPGRRSRVVVRRIQKPAGSH